MGLTQFDNNTARMRNAGFQRCLEVFQMSLQEALKEGFWSVRPYDPELKYTNIPDDLYSDLQKIKSKIGQKAMSYKADLGINEVGKPLVMECFGELIPELQGKFSKQRRLASLYREPIHHHGCS